MSDAIRTLHDYLAKSPSVIYPEDVLSYLSAIETENARLRKLVQYIYDECYGDDWFNEQAEVLGFEQNF